MTILSTNINESCADEPAIKGNKPGIHIDNHKICTNYEISEIDQFLIHVIQSSIKYKSKSYMIFRKSSTSIMMIYPKMRLIFVKKKIFQKC